MTLGMLVVSSALAATSKPTVKSVGEGLMCQCGCAETVTLCNHLNCWSRTEMQALIQKQIDAGKDETAIVQDFVLRYGVKVLATPPASGFNLTVWVLPGASVIFGLVVLIVLARSWGKKPRPPRAAPPGAIDPKLLAAVEEEMRKSGVRS